jgi:hypothetical protein
MKLGSKGSTEGGISASWARDERASVLRLAEG